MTGAPIVSVVMCTYNGSLYLAEQLDSIQQQTYAHLQIIIADDCSNDDTYALLKEAARLDERIFCYQNTTRLGFNANYTQALQQATGNYIAISDQDDIWRKDKIELLLQLLLHSDAIMAYCHSMDVMGDIIPAVSSSYAGRIAYFEGTDARRLFLRNTISGHTMLFRSALLQHLFPYSTTVFYDFWLAVLAAVNGGIIFSKETMVYRRIHPNNASISFLARTVKSNYPYLFLQKMILQAVKAFGMPDEQIVFGDRLAANLKKSRNGRCNISLFLFCVYHRKLIFYYKPDKPGVVFSQLKHSWRIACGRLFSLPATEATG
jgi:glycosyltransferase involved in cell wall biosynthesis